MCQISSYAATMTRGVKGFDAPKRKKQRPVRHSLQGRIKFGEAELARLNTRQAVFDPASAVTIRPWHLLPVLVPAHRQWQKGTSCSSDRYLGMNQLSYLATNATYLDYLLFLFRPGGVALFRPQPLYIWFANNRYATADQPLVNCAINESNFGHTHVSTLEYLLDVQANILA